MQIQHIGEINLIASLLARQDEYIDDARSSYSLFADEARLAIKLLSGQFEHEVLLEHL